MTTRQTQAGKPLHARFPCRPPGLIPWPAFRAYSLQKQAGRPNVPQQLVHLLLRVVHGARTLEPRHQALEAPRKAVLTSCRKRFASSPRSTKRRALLRESRCRPGSAFTPRKRASIPTQRPKASFLRELPRRTHPRSRRPGSQIHPNPSKSFEILRKEAVKLKKAGLRAP